MKLVKLSWDEALKRHMPEPPMETPKVQKPKRVRLKECRRCGRVYSGEECPVCGK